MSVFMQPIYTQTVGSGGAAVIAFNNIPQGFTDLKLVMSLRSTATGSLTGGFADGSYVAVNNDLTNVSWTFMYAATTTTNTSRGRNSIPYLGPINGAGTTASTFSSCEVYFADYTNAFSKQMKVDVAAENNSASNYFVSNLAILHGRNNPITSLQVYSGEGSWAQHSTVTLYGISERFDTEIPTAPAIGTVTDQAGFASVEFTPGSNDRVDNYVVTSTPSNSTTYGTSSPISTPAVLGTSYTYQVAAVNSLGSSPSSLSGAVTTANNYASIATASGDGTATSVLFTNIPQNYKNLQIRYQARTIRSQTGEGWYIRFNGDSGSNYYGHYVYATESASGTSFGTNGAGTTADLPSIPGSLVAANMPGVGIVDINNYAATTQFKTVKSIGGFNNNGSTSYTYFNMYTWQNYSPVTTLQVLSNGGLVTGSRIELFGIS
jgi:hypothetical protein